MSGGASCVLVVRQRSTLIRFLHDHVGLNHLSKTAIRKHILQSGLCRVNSRVENVANLLLQPKDVVELPSLLHLLPSSSPSPSSPSPSSSCSATTSTSYDDDKSTMKQTAMLGQAWSTLYEDAEIRIVNKPASWTCTPDACRRLLLPTATTLNDVTSGRIVHGENEAEASNEPRGNQPTTAATRRSQEQQHYQLVHRLDKCTSGALMLAKSDEARRRWCEVFRQRRVHKEYLAIVDGVPLRTSGTQQSLLRRCVGLERGQVKWQSVPLPVSTTTTTTRQRKKKSNGGGEGAAGEGGAAVTRWRVLGSGRCASLVACQPVTGRTHQIRVHMASMGHPIVVDTLYSRSFRADLFAQRPLLHAFRIKADDVFAQAPLPADFLAALDALGIQFDASLLLPPPPPSSSPCSLSGATAAVLRSDPLATGTKPNERLLE